MGLAEALKSSLEKCSYLVNDLLAVKEELAALKGQNQELA